MPTLKTCPRCGATFECKYDDITSCQCATIGLNDYQRSFLKNRYTSCLCHDCLLEIKSTIHPSTDNASETPSGKT